MKFAVSNIAWRPDQRLDAYRVLADAGCTGLEIAPGLLFPEEADAFAPSPAALVQVLGEAHSFGLDLVSMQSLLFGATGVALFGAPDERERLLVQVRRAIDLAARLGIRNLVFGSPQQRVIPEGMKPVDAGAIATEAFHRLGDHALAAGCFVAVEPNPAAYGTNFLTGIEQAFAFVARVAHPAVTLNFDVGAIHMARAADRTPEYLREMLPLVSHVHVSEPELAPAPADAAEARALLTTLEALGYQHWISIEMRAVADQEIAAIAAALDRLMTATAPVAA